MKKNKREICRSEENLEIVMIPEFFFFFSPTPAVSKASHGRDLVAEKEVEEARTFVARTSRRQRN